MFIRLVEIDIRSASARDVDAQMNLCERIWDFHTLASVRQPWPRRLYLQLFLSAEKRGLRLAGEIAVLPVTAWQRGRVLDGRSPFLSRFQGLTKSHNTSLGAASQWSC
jgi:hypothetical protein